MQWMHFKINHWGVGNLTYTIQFQKWVIVTPFIFWIYVHHYFCFSDLCICLNALCSFDLYLSISFFNFLFYQENPSEKDLNQGTLVVFNLDSSVSIDEICQIFGVYGEIKEVIGSQALFWFLYLQRMKNFPINTFICLWFADPWIPTKASS